ncbi:predicted protein [Uncinocarpus reesii 1704]|uniref:Uncharacterized protein n=1 Tax=Uncinocarpus reesii (strain UAMH 1704) TaxID=336963 RepID=C4JQQ6_UNCRE|nr:uncharacterized protein UREG_03401 [Uncinocarpus reesii 1704]EEP78555.1 predicted protein [Uncinocarpus reesii 1704]
MAKDDPVALEVWEKVEMFALVATQDVETMSVWMSIWTGIPAGARIAEPRVMGFSVAKFGNLSWETHHGQDRVFASILTLSQERSITSACTPSIQSPGPDMPSLAESSNAMAARFQSGLAQGVHESGRRRST